MPKEGVTFRNMPWIADFPEGPCIYKGVNIAHKKPNKKPCPEKGTPFDVDSEPHSWQWFKWSYTAKDLKHYQSQSLLISRTSRFIYCRAYDIFEGKEKTTLLNDANALSSVAGLLDNA